MGNTIKANKTPLTKNMKKVKWKKLAYTKMGWIWVKEMSRKEFEKKFKIPTPHLPKTSVGKR